MTQLRSQLAASVYRYAGVTDGPLPEGCPLELVFEVLSDSEDAMLRDLDLSDQNRRVAKLDKALTTQSFSIETIAGQPSYAFLQTDPYSQLWYPVEIVNHASINEAAWAGRPAVAFFGSPARAEISWQPDVGQTLRIWYDRSKDITPTMGSESEIDALYESHLKLCAAAQVRELMNLPVGEVLQARLAKGETQWQKFAKTSRQQGSVQKPMNYQPRGYRRGTFGLDPSRYYTP